MRTNAKLLAILWLLLVAVSVVSSDSTAATASNFSSANSAISSAFVATHNAQEKGGNVTSLIRELNVAISLVEKAGMENMTNSTQSVLDLQNATQIANLVTSQSVAIGQKGVSAVQVRYEVSIGSAVAIAIVALLVYIYGARIYRRAWLYAYRDYVVKPSG